MGLIHVMSNIIDTSLGTLLHISTEVLSPGFVPVDLSCPTSPMDLFLWSMLTINNSCGNQKRDSLRCLSVVFVSHVFTREAPLNQF